MSDIDDDLPPDAPASGAPESGRPEGVEPISIEEEMRRSYLDYAMSVIVSRAIPDARDGLKPVHRRILWSMHENGHTFDKPYNKSAKTVGDVMGTYHPHGDQAIYDALVRMAQPWSMSLKLIDGQGNFGSIDNDPPAAMRYTESRMAEAANYLLADIDKDTVDFQPNYDGKDREPTVLPARYPNMLVNGAGGIAVGMATNIPPHNLSEVVDAAVALLDDPNLTDEALLEIVPGPDFPTGAQIMGRAGARRGLMTGRGSVVMRSKVHTEQIGQRQALIITEIPYQVNKATMFEKIAELVREKRVEGIADMRDESDRHGVRVVIEMKREANADVLLNQLYRFTPMQVSFGVNMLALDRGRPRVFTLRELLASFLSFRKDVIARRTKFELAKARDRAHVLVGLALAVANIDEVIATIRRSPDASAAREALRARTWPAGDMRALVELIADPRSMVSEGGEIRLTEEQAKAILDLRLNRLTALGGEEIGNEATGLMGSISDLLEILRSRERVVEIIREELLETKAKFGVPRRSVFLDSELEVEDEDLISREEMVVTLTTGGYVKRTPLSIYRTQARGGKGRAGMAFKEDDLVAEMLVASTHAPVLFFTASGMVYKEKVWRLPQGAPATRGKFIGNVIPAMAADDPVTSVMALPEDEQSWDQLDVMFATRSGYVRRNKLSDFVQVNRNGKIAMKLDEGDAIVGVRFCSTSDDVLLTTRGAESGKKDKGGDMAAFAIRFQVGDVRVFKGRDSSGVRGVRLAEGDEVVSMAILRHVDVTPAEIRAYLKSTEAVSGEPDDAAGSDPDDAEDSSDEAYLSPARYGELSAQEEQVLTMTTSGYGKRTSSYDYRVTGRGGKGLRAHDLNLSGGQIAAAFPVEKTDDVIIVTDGGQMVRTSVDAIKTTRRARKGVIVLRLYEGERVVSVRRIADAEAGAGDETEAEIDGGAEQ